jgi:hypothetical protein
MMKVRATASRTSLIPFTKRDGACTLGPQETWQNCHETLSAIHCFKIEFFGADYEVKKLKLLHPFIANAARRIARHGKRE